MNIITAPKIHVVSSPQFFPHPDYEIPDDGDDSVKIGAFAAKGCYDSFGKTGRANVANQEAVIESNHGSVLEHIHVGLFIEGITRAASLELNRHRPFNISQRSTRYTKEEDAAYVLEPYFATLYDQSRTTTRLTLPEHIALTHHLDIATLALTGYARNVTQLEALNPLNLTGFDLRKWARGKARNLLPHGLETRGVWTNNLRGFRWFIELRSEQGAEPEIRRLADTMLTALRTVTPFYFADFTIKETYDGIPVWVASHYKI